MGLVVFACAYPIARELEMDRDIATMFDPSDPVLIAYQDLQATFGGNAVTMIVYRDAELMSPAGIIRSDRLTEQVLRVEGVRDALSPSRISGLVAKINPTAFLAKLSSETPALLDADDPVASGMDRVFSGYTHSSDHRFAAVVAILDPEHSQATIETLRDLGANFASDFDGTVGEVSLVGEPVLIHDGFSLIERDGAKLAIWTSALLAAVVLISMFDLRFVLLMSVVVFWSVTITRAALVLLAIKLSLVSTILTAITTVVTVAAVLHLGVRFRRSRRHGLSPHDAAVDSLSNLMLPIFWTCATDSVGFAALTWSKILPVQQFGQMIAVAAIAVFVGLAMFAPAAMTLPGTAVGRSIDSGQRWFAIKLRRLCRRIAAVFVSAPRRTLISSAVVAVLAVIMLSRSETETSFLKNFRDRSPVVAAYQSVETNFGGAGVWDIIVTAPADIDNAFLQLVRQLQSDLRRIDVDGEGLTKVLSVADIDSVAAESMLLKLAPVEARLAGMRVALPVFSDALLSPANSSVEAQDRQGVGEKQPHQTRRLRIMLRSREHLGAEQKSKLIDRVEAVVQEHTNSIAWQSAVNDAGNDPIPVDGKVTGYYVIMADLVSQLVRDQWRCFLASGIMVWLLLLTATRSIRLATAALLPNLLPVLIVLALVAIFGGKINMGAAMIAAVSVGLSIDGSVHFLANYQKHRRRGHNARPSAIHAASNIGVPVILATIALVIGFSVLATSEFIPTATFGILVAATMAAGTVVNLTLLPSLVSWIDGSSTTARSAGKSI